MSNKTDTIKTILADKQIFTVELKEIKMITYRICLETHSMKEAGEIVEELRKLNKGEVLMVEMPEWYESINEEKKETNLCSD